MEKNFKRQLRIVYILDEPSVKEGGGAETHAFALAKHLIRKGCHVSIVVPQSKSWRTRTRTQDGFSIFFVPVGVAKTHPLFSLIYNILLVAILTVQSMRYDIIHVHGARGLRAVAAVSKLLGKKTFVTIVRRLHWLFIFKQKPKTFLQKLSNRLILSLDGYVTISKDITNLLLKSKIPADRIFYIPNGIEIYPAASPKQTLRHQLHLPQTVPVALFVGRLHWQKNIPFLIRAWETLTNSASEARLILLGDGPIRDEIEVLIERRNLKQSVECRGFVENISEYMQCADIFILPSRMEGCPMALLEAMGHGLACIASDSPGNDEIIIHNENGYLIKFPDEQDLIRHTVNLIHDEHLRRRLGTAAQNRIKERFSIDTICDKHLVCYQPSWRSCP